MQVAPSTADTAIALQDETRDASTAPPGQGSDRARRRWWLLGVVVAALVTGLVLTWEALNQSEAPIDITPVERPPDPGTTTSPEIEATSLDNKGDVAPVEATTTSPDKGDDAPVEGTKTKKLDDKEIRRQIVRIVNNTCNKEYHYNNTEINVSLKTSDGKTTIISIKFIDGIGPGPLASQCIRRLEGKALNGAREEGGVTKLRVTLLQHG